MLLKYKDHTKPILDLWADRLAAMSRSAHRVPVTTIRRWMDRWKWDLTMENIIKHEANGQPDSPICVDR